MSRLDDLNSQVTAAIRDMEDATRKVAVLEAEIAGLTSPTSEEGRIARRGAIRTAVACGDNDLTRTLTDRFLNETGSDAAWRRELIALLP